MSAAVVGAAVPPLFNVEMNLFASVKSPRDSKPDRKHTLGRFIELIKAPNPKLRLMIEEIRKIGADSKEGRALKGSLPVWQIGNCGPTRSNVIENGLAQIDVDASSNPNLKPEEMQSILSKHPSCVVAAISPSGKGAKGVFRVKVGFYLECWKGIVAELKGKGVCVDTSKGRPDDFCYMTLDPGVYVNSGATEAHPIPIQVDAQTNGDLAKTATRLNAAVVTIDSLPLESADNPADIERAIKYLQIAPIAEDGGGGDTRLYAVFARLRDFGISREMAGSLVIEHYNERCSPPWGAADQQHFEEKLENAYTYAKNPFGCESTEVLRKKGEIPLPPIRSAGEILASPPIKPMELIFGLLHRGAKLVLGGGSKSFKTWCLLDMAISIAAGIPWLNWNTEKARVLYINFEVQDAFFWERIEKICAARDIQIPTQTLDIWNLRGYATDILRIESGMISRTEEGSYGLIVIDPIYKLMGGRDENSAGDIGDVMNAIERIATKTGAAVAFGAHFAKGNASAKESIDRISGSGVFARDPDSILTLTRHQEDECFVMESVLRNHPPIPSLVARWKFPLMTLDERLDPKALKRPAAHNSGQALENAKALLTLLAEPLRHGEWLKSAQDELGVKKPTFNTHLKLLSQAGLVQRRADNRWEKL